MVDEMGFTKIFPNDELGLGAEACSFRAMVPLFVVPLCQLVSGELGVNLVEALNLVVPIPTKLLEWAERKPISLPVHPSGNIWEKSAFLDPGEYEISSPEAFEFPFPSSSIELS